MRPNFALNLTFEGIGLLHRVPSGWHLVGEVALESPDLGGALAVLRQTALALDPAGLRSKLVIPNEQIRYLTVPADPHAGEAEVRAALDGATPYAVDDLAYDWTFEGGTLHIAAAARETLVEAENFALDHGFNPVSFVATPDQAVFPGEPFFGLTTAAPALVGAGEPVARDLQPIRVIGHARLPEPQPQPEPQRDPQPEAWRDAGSAPVAVGDDAGQTAAGPKPAATGLPANAPEANAPDISAPDTSAPASDEDRITPATITATKITAATITAASVPPPVPPVPRFASTRVRTKTAPEAGQAVTAQQPPPSLVRSLAPSPPQSAPQSGQPSRPPQPPAMMAPRASAPAPTATAPALAAASAPASAAADSLRQRAAAPLPTRPDPGPPPAPRKPLAPASRTAVPGPAAAAAPAAQRGRPGAALGGAAAAIFASLGRAFRRPPRDSAAPPLLPAARKTADEQARMTVFGARKPATVAGPTPGARGKPRNLGLGLTLALLVFLAAVAAWASLFGETAMGWLGSGDDPAIATLPDDGAIDTRLITPEELADTEAEIGMDPASVEDLAPVELAALDGTAPDAETDAETGAETGAGSVSGPPGLSVPGTEPGTEPGTGPGTVPVIAAPPTPEETLARYAATGIWQVAPDAPGAPAQVDLDQLYVASIDPAVVSGDAVALPGVTLLRPDAAPGALASPVAAGTLFRLDPRGLVEATPEGALTPDGVRVIAGRPPVLPPAAALTRAAPPVAAAAPAVDARLAAFRPRLRPETLADGAERVALGGLTRSELAGFRPRPRPAALTARAEAEAAAVEAATAATRPPSAAASTAAIAVAPPAGASALAAVAPPAVKPRPRPQDLEAPEPRGRDTDAGSAEPPANATSAGGISREEAQDDEGEVQVASARGKTVKPKVPSQANVAKAATEKNVLNLREVNLIGVYGTQASRRALVRLSNGRYQKVKVGDRVDGGRVVAISDGELRYTKGGRNVTLKMPRS